MVASSRSVSCSRASLPHPHASFVNLQCDCFGCAQLRRGFVGVVNRSQKDINEQVPIEEARQQERLFFERHGAYRSMASRMGSAYLARLLNSVRAFLS